MAILEKNIFNNLSGSLSNITFRIRNGKIVAYARPAKQKMSKSAASINAQKRFALTVNFAKEINSAPSLSEIWKLSKLKGSNAYQKIIKHNVKHIGENSLTLHNIITPPSTLLHVDSIIIKETHLQFSVNTQTIQNLINPPHTVYCLVYLGEPHNERDAPYLIKLLSTVIDNGLPEKIEINLDSLADKIGSAAYNKFIIFFALCGKNNKGKPVWTSTASLQVL
jgi:hypothetical protein